jgi:hypothetical protein
MGLYAAIELDDLEKVKHLILKNKKEMTDIEFLEYINAFNSCGETPLLTNLQQEGNYKHDITVLLLENSADPNKYNKSKDVTDYAAVITPTIISGDKSEARILILYGSTIPKLDFAKLVGSIEVFAHATYELACAQKNRLQQALNDQAGSKFISAFSNFKESADIWYTVSLDELNSIFKAHYQQKALNIYKQSIECYANISAHQRGYPNLQENYELVIARFVELQQTLKLPLTQTTANIIEHSSNNTGITNFLVRLGRAFHKLSPIKDKQQDYNDSTSLHLLSETNPNMDTAKLKLN